jgi:hypothetical protein
MVLTLVAESGATARTSLGVGTGNDVQFDSFGVGTAASGTTGEIRATNDVTAFYSSDVALKENIVNIPNPLEAIKKLNGVLFDWKKSYIDRKRWRRWLLCEKKRCWSNRTRSRKSFTRSGSTKTRWN